MNTFKNIHFMTRDYECTNVVACRALGAPGPDWEPCAESVLLGLTHLYTSKGVQFYGYL